jgi:hypothetical protein
MKIRVLHPASRMTALAPRPIDPDPSLHRLGAPAEHRQGIAQGEAKSPPYVLSISKSPPPTFLLVVGRATGWLNCWPTDRLAL